MYAVIDATVGVVWGIGKTQTTAWRDVWQWCDIDDRIWDASEAMRAGWPAPVTAPARGGKNVVIKRLPPSRRWTERTLVVLGEAIGLVCVEMRDGEEISAQAAADAVQSMKHIVYLDDDGRPAVID